MVERRGPYVLVRRRRLLQRGRGHSIARPRILCSATTFQSEAVILETAKGLWHLRESILACISLQLPVKEPVRDTALQSNEAPKAYWDHQRKRYPALYESHPTFEAVTFP